MNELPPLLRDQRKADADQLRLLAIFHYIVGGLAFVGCAFLFLHYLLFSTLMTDPRMWQGQKSGPPPDVLLEMFSWFYIIGGTIAVGSALCNLLSGMAISARRYRVFSLIVAGLNCLHIPVGTVLGVFTFIVLLRDSVRELYEAQDEYPAAPRDW